MASRDAASAPAAPARATLLRGCAVVPPDGSGSLLLDRSILLRDGRVAWVRPADAEEAPGDAEVLDASGATAVPGMVDCHSHVLLPGGAHWIERGLDPPERLLAAAERNGRLLTAAGVRWARDVGAPVGVDPADGRGRALSLGLRERWASRPEMPRIRAAGSWVTRAGTLPGGLSVEADDGDALLAHALAQLDDGADLVKLYLDGPDPSTAPWTASEVRRVVAACHARGARVTAHAGRLDGARVCAEAGVDAIEHGFELDAATAARMAENAVALVTTLTVLRSWHTFARTTRLPRFARDEDGGLPYAERAEAAAESVRHAAAAGVLIAAGTDFGGGSPRAGELAWEVEALVDAGLEPAQALAAATRNGGALLGEPGVGVIDEGGPADLFLVHGDPLSDPAALWRVWFVGWAGG